MRILEHSQLVPGEFPRSVLTLGNFDGVHRGHQALLAQVLGRARALGAAALVYTFHPHPLRVLNPAFCPPRLTAFEERVARISAAGIDALVWARFDREYAAVEPEPFARDTLAACLGAVEVWVGPDFAFGRGRRGSLDFLRRVGRDLGFSVQVLEAFTLDGEVVSSTRIRQAVVEGDLDTAARLLGRPYALHGPVVHGAARGRTLGYPTANLLVREECLPPPGVYSAWARLGGVLVPAAVNVGPNPTFGDGSEVTVEAYLLDYTGNLYGAELELQFAARVREERTFSGASALKDQIGRDVERVRALLGVPEPRAVGSEG